MAQRRATIRPSGGKKALKIRLRITAAAVPEGGAAQVTDCLLQAGSTVTGWTPHVTELPWSAGIVGGAP